MATFYHHHRPKQVCFIPEGEPVNSQLSNRLKYTMKRIYLILFLNLSLYASPLFLENFYKAYMQNMLTGHDSANVELCEQYMRLSLIKKMQRVSEVIDCDAIIHSQDVNECAIKTLSVEDIGNDWYLVVYFWKESDVKTKISIPVKLTTVDNREFIDYITPPWYDYSVDSPICGINNSVDDNEGYLFVVTFYKQYLDTYCNLSENIDIKLRHQRTQYFTNQANEQYEQMKHNSFGDGLLYYDPLIDNSDFDFIWLYTLNIQQIDKYEYDVSYIGYGVSHRIRISLKKVKNSFMIDSILI